MNVFKIYLGYSFQNNITLMALMQSMWKHDDFFGIVDAMTSHCGSPCFQCVLSQFFVAKCVS